MSAAAFVYDNILIQQRLDPLVGGKIVTVTAGDILYQNGAPASTTGTTVPLNIGTSGQVLTVVAGLPSWQSQAAGVIAGNGLTLTGTTLDVVGSFNLSGGAALIDAISSPHEVFLRSNATAGQPLLSSGTPTNEPTYGPLSLSTATSVTGVLQPVNGGTGLTSFGPFAPNQVLVTNGAGLVVSSNTVDLSQINDTNNNLEIKFTAAATPVNYLQISNAATTVAPSIVANGTDTNVNLLLQGKGTGKVELGNVPLQFPNVDGTAGQVLVTAGLANPGVLSFASVEIVNTGTVVEPVVGTPVVAFTFPVAPQTAYYFEAKFIGRGATDASTDMGTFIINSNVYSNASSVISLLDSTRIFANKDAAFTATITTTGTNVFFNVNSAAPAVGPVTWKYLIKILSV